MMKKSVLKSNIISRVKPVFILIFSFSIIFFPHFSFSSSKEVLNIPRLSHPPKIDGVIENPFWEEEALKIEDFFQFTPKEMGEPSEKTVAYIGYDHKNLYFAFRCYDKEPDKIRASVTNRDGCIDDDWIIIFLDTFNEKRRAFSFIINPIGIQLDCIRTEQGGNDNMDASWDTVFSSEGKMDKEGYTVEMAIPFKSIRFPDKEKKIWGITLGRNIPRKGEIIIWPDFTRKIPGLLSQEGQISIRGTVEKGKNLEIMPIVTSLTTQEEKADFQPGVNVKYGVSSDLTLDFTANPDFSHIEADAPQIDINQRFALYYSEKRPFFLEGMEIFRFPQIEMVYTRRIIDPILGGKATGKLGRFTYGFLTAYDQNPTESLWEVHKEGKRKDDNALFNIFRMKTDVSKDSYLGFCVADKEIDGSYNRVAGIDGELRFKNKIFFTFQALASKTKFEEEESSISPALYADFFYYTKYWYAGTYWMSIHPDFEAASGFVNRVNYRTIGAYTSFRAFPQKKLLNMLSLNLRAGQRYAYFENIVQDRWAIAELYFRFNEWSQMNIMFQNAMERYEGIKFNINYLTVSGETNLIGWLPLGFYFRTGHSIYYDPDDPFLGWSNSYGLYLNFKPSKRLQMSVDFSKYTFWEERGGEQLIDYNVVRQRTTYQISKTLSLRTIVDYNHFYKEIYGSFLVSWILKPGTVFFLGLDNDFLKNEVGRYTRESYSIFIKFSYWWRI
ncbi:MAG: DUF5916 domain-containing protein [Candidatus Aminicenantaceae bacterium]